MSVQPTPRQELRNATRRSATPGQGCRVSSRAMEPVIDHIEITVKDMSTAIPFYDRLLPLLGFDLRNRSEAMVERHEKHVVSYEHPRLGFAITSPLPAFASEVINRRKPGSLHHLAFRAKS